MLLRAVLKFVMQEPKYKVQSRSWWAVCQNTLEINVRDGVQAERTAVFPMPQALPLLAEWLILSQVFSSLVSGIESKERFAKWQLWVFWETWRQVMGEEEAILTPLYSPTLVLRVLNPSEQLFLWDVQRSQGFGNKHVLPWHTVALPGF